MTNKEELQTKGKKPAYRKEFDGKTFYLKTEIDGQDIEQAERYWQKRGFLTRTEARADKALLYVRPINEATLVDTATKIVLNPAILYQSDQYIEIEWDYPAQGLATLNFPFGGIKRGERMTEIPKDWACVIGTGQIRTVELWSEEQ